MPLEAEGSRVKAAEWRQQADGSRLWAAGWGQQVADITNTVRQVKDVFVAA